MVRVGIKPRHEINTSNRDEYSKDGNILIVFSNFKDKLHTLMDPQIEKLNNDV